MTIDVRERIAGDEDALVVPDDVLAWERRHRSLPDRAAIVAVTGWGERAPGDGYLNADPQGVMHFPGFSPTLMEFLTEERPGIRALGIDGPSLDAVPRATSRHTPTGYRAVGTA